MEGNIAQLQPGRAGGLTAVPVSYTHLELLSDLTRDVTSEEVQKTVKKLIELGEQSAPDMDMGENYWEAITEEFLKNQKVIEGFDKIHGSGAAKFMAEAYRYYLRRGQQQCL